MTKREFNLSWTRLYNRFLALTSLSAHEYWKEAIIKGEWLRLYNADPDGMYYSLKSMRSMLVTQQSLRPIAPFRIALSWKKQDFLCGLMT